MMKKIGRGTTRTIRVGEIDLSVRMNVFSLGFGIIQKPDRYAGRILVRNVDADYWQIVENAYYAYRQTEHILYRYGINFYHGEKNLLENLREGALRLNLRSLGIEGGSRTRRDQEQFDGLVARFTEPLTHARKLTKTAAREQISAVLGSRNLPAVRARTVAARGRLLERFEEVLHIEPHILARQRGLWILIKLSELRFETLHRYVAELLKYDGMKPLYDRSRRLAIATRFESIAQELESIDFEPHRSMCKLTIDDLRAARDVLRKPRLTREDWQTLRTHIMCCRIATILKRKQIALERVIISIMRHLLRESPQLPVMTIKRAISGILEPILHMSDEKLRVPVIEEFTGHMQKALSSLDSSSPDAPESLYDQLKKASLLL
ncbi:MAG: hypothetical protein AAB490_05885 [Patescibacteria group bacterium]